MAKKVTVVISQGQSANPTKRGLEEDSVAVLLFERGVEVTVVPNLYDLAPDGTGMLCLKSITGDVIVLTWLIRAALIGCWRNGIKGHEGRTLLKADDDDEDQERDEIEQEMEAAQSEAVQSEPRNGEKGAGDVPNRRIYCLDLRTSARIEPYVEEVRRIVNEANVQTVSLMSWIGGKPKPEQLDRFLNPNAGPAPAGLGNLLGASENGSNHGAAPESVASGETNGSPVAVVRIEEQTARRWYPVIDFSRCTNCLECLDFCLFGVYGVDKVDSILVEQPDNCKKGCPACSRVCPENAIIFPQHKTPAIAGSAGDSVGGLKIDLSQLFGAPSAIEVAALERDVELVADGRSAVGLSVGIPKRQADKKSEPRRDDLDDSMDELDRMEL